MNEELFWNTRGNLVIARDEKAMKEFEKRGFMAASEEERRMYKPGQYLPAYDQGDKAQQQIIVNNVPTTNQGGTIRIIEV